MGLNDLDGQAGLRWARLIERTSFYKSTPVPLISIVIPTYNRVDTLGRVIEAYRSQTLPPEQFEILLVDNESRLETSEVVESILSSSSPLPFCLRYFRLSPNRGPGPARNVGISASRAPIVLIACDDTFPTPELLTEHLRAHRERPAGSVAILGHIEWSPAAAINSLMRYVTEVSGNQYAYFAIRNPENAGFPFFYASNLSLKRSFLLQQDRLFDPELTYGFEDVELGYRLTQKGLRIAYHPAALVHHEHHYDLLRFAGRMYRVGETAPVLVQKHPELQQFAFGIPPPADHPREFSACEPVIRATQNATDEIDRLDLTALNLMTVSGHSLGQFLHATRCELFGDAIQRAMKAGVRAGLDRLAEQSVVLDRPPHDSRDMPPSENQLDSSKDRTDDNTDGNAIGNAIDRTFDVSVIIPTHDRTDTLGAVLAAYASQTITPGRFEVIVIDDESQPETAALVESFARRPEGVPYQLRYFWHAPNGGPGAARNVGIRAARGDLILLACDDTIPAPTLLEEHLHAHSSRPSKSVAVIGSIEWAPDIEINGLMRYITDEGGNQYAFFRIRDVENAGHSFFYGSNVSLKRAFLAQQDELFDPLFIYGYEDTDFGYRLEKNGLRLVYHSAAVVYHDHTYTLEGFCKRMYRVGLMAPRLAAKHPDLADLMDGDDPDRVFQRVPLEALVPGIQKIGAAIAEIEAMDLDRLNIIDVGGTRLGLGLSLMRREMYQHVFSDAYKAGIAEGIERFTPVTNEAQQVCVTVRDALAIGQGGAG